VGADEENGGQNISRLVEVPSRHIETVAMFHFPSPHPTAIMPSGIDVLAGQPHPLWDTRRLWSLWDMAEHIVASLITLTRSIAQAQSMTEQKTATEQIGPTILDESREVLERVSKGANFALLFPIVTPHLRRLAEAMSSGMTVAELRQGLVEFQHRLDDDVQTHVYILVTKPEYYNQEKLFGEFVFENFSSANNDIFEAGMCLALSRATACVMHLMRAVEVALSALASELDVSKQNDWGAYLRKIAAELDRRATSSGARTPDEQFYSEAAANFDRMRRAYRNPTMHPEKTY
jgi:hypothetical protein